MTLPEGIGAQVPTGESPLAGIASFKTYIQDAAEYQRECDTLDTFVCSSFYYLRFLDANNAESLADSAILAKKSSVDFYIG